MINGNVVLDLGKATTSGHSIKDVLQIHATLLLSTLPIYPSSLVWLKSWKYIMLNNQKKKDVRLVWHDLFLVKSQLAIVQSLSRVQLFATPWTAACQPSLSFTVSWSLLKLMSIESVMLSNHFILCHPLFPLFPSIRVFYNDLAIPLGFL